MDKYPKPIVVLLSILVGIIGFILLMIIPWFNFGGFVDRILGRKYPQASADKASGRTRKIMVNHDPLRNQSLVELENGEIVQLPAGVRDRDVAEIIEVSPGNYSVTAKHKRITDE